MDLKLKEVAELLKVADKTIYRWIKVGKIPYYRINHQYRFKADEINSWVFNNGYSRPQSNFASAAPTCSSGDLLPVSIIDCLKRGGIVYNISGNNVADILKNTVDAIKIPSSLDKMLLLTKLVAREAMASTSIGAGIAFPHPRVPLIENICDESVTLCFLHEAIDFHALDNILVSTLFVILSADQSRHLQILARLSYLCRQAPFIELLNRQALREEFYQYLANIDF